MNKSESKESKEKNSIGKFNLLRLNSFGKRTKYKQEKYKSEKQRNTLEKQIELDKIQDNSQKLEAEKKMTDKVIENTRNRGILCKLERAIQYLEIKNKNDKKEVKKTKWKGIRMKIVSVLCGIISALTTCFGIKVEATPEYLFKVIAILFMCVCVNMQIGTVEDYKEKFCNNNLKDKTLYLIKVLIITGYTYFSIKTNYSFWSEYFSGVELVIFACLFDLMAFEKAMESNKIRSMSYNDKHEKKMTEVLEQHEKEEEKKTQRKNLKAS